MKPYDADRAGGRRPEAVAPVGMAVRFLGTGLSPKAYSGVIVAVEPDAKFGRLYRVRAEGYPSEDGTCLRPRHALYEAKAPAKQATEANMRIINRPLAADAGGRRWLTIQCCGATFQCRDDNKRAACASCKRSRTIKELLFELHDREESERAKRLAAADYDRVARQVASAAGGGGSDRGPIPGREGRGRWLALDTMDHIISCIRRSQREMSEGSVRDGANLVRVAFDELRDLHADLGKGVLTDDAWDV